MLTIDDVLHRLAKDGEVKVNGVRLFSAHIPGGFMCADDIPIWIVQAGQELFKFTAEDLMEAVDKFLDLTQPVSHGIKFPDANELRELNKQASEAEYNQWCAEHQTELQMIAQSILQANAAGKRTIGFDVPLNDTEGKYRRYFAEHHYEVVIQHYSAERVEKRGLALCNLSWSEMFKRR